MRMTALRLNIAFWVLQKCAVHAENYAFDAKRDFQHQKQNFIIKNAVFVIKTQRSAPNTHSWMFCDCLISLIFVDVFACCLNFLFVSDLFDVF